MEILVYLFKRYEIEKKIEEWEQCDGYDMFTKEC